MRVRILSVVAVAGLVIAAAALARPNAQLTGKFETKIAGKSAALNGTWRITLTRIGRFSTTRNGKLAVTGAVGAANGKFAVTDTGGPYACKGAESVGAYTYTLKGKMLTMKAKLDLCSGRKTVLTTHPLTKIG